MQSDDKQRFAQMAENYDQMAPFLVPMYEFMQSEVIGEYHLWCMVGGRKPAKASAG